MIWLSLTDRFALQFAVASGATVIATSSSNEKLVTATKLGAKHIINYKEKPDWDNEVKTLASSSHHICDLFVLSRS